MKTSRPVKRKKTTLETIRWKKVVMIPLIVIAVAGMLFGGFYVLNTNSLNNLEARIAKQQQELQEYLRNNEGKILIQNALLKAEKLAIQYDFDGAIQALTENEKIQSETQIKEKIEEYKQSKTKLVPYTSEVPVLFTHNLINNPTLAFAAGYKGLYLTVEEFKKIIQELYDRNYILVSFEEVFSFEGGTWTRKELLLPENKKPFILNVDENAYDAQKPLQGFARGLAIRDGEFVTRILSSTTVELTGDGDVVPIIESFIKIHPDFSYKGSRGMLSLTGYAGTLGYRLTNEIELNDVKALVSLLKEKGWTFACTSFSDSVQMYQTKPVASTIGNDLQNWNSVIRPIVGDTTVFISPFGIRFEGQILNTILSFGYNVYFYDSIPTTSMINNGVLYLSRIGLTEENLRNYKDYIASNFFDSDNILDPSR